jgi:hypothetical protein
LTILLATFMMVLRLVLRKEAAIIEAFSAHAAAGQFPPPKRRRSSQRI